jgi:hypothetical protein
MPTIAFLWVLLGQPAFSAHLRLDLVFNGERLPPSVKTSAIEEASRIWAPYDVDLREVGSTEAGRDGAVRLMVSVASRPARNVSADALGSIYFVDGSPTALILLYPNTIAALMPMSLMLGPGVHERSPFSYEHMLGRVTGRALAHEIGHYLLRSRRHSERGLMRGKPQMTEMIELSRRGFALAEEDVWRLMSVIPEGSRSSDRAAPPLQELALGGVFAPRDCGVVR